MYAGFSGYVCVLVCNGCINCRHCRAIFRKLTPFPFGYPDTSDWCGSTVASSRMADCVFALGGNVLWSEFPVFPSQPSAEVSVSGKKVDRCSFPGENDSRAVRSWRSRTFHLIILIYFDDKSWQKYPEVFPPTNWHPKKIDATSGPWAF